MGITTLNPLIPAKAGIQFKQLCASFARSLFAGYRVVARYERV